MFVEYPKSLYFNGDVEQEHVIVRSADEEAAKRAEGFRVAWEPEAKAQEPESMQVSDAPKRRGRPPKNAA